jgi:hypothetical protein
MIEKFNEKFFKENFFFVPSESNPLFFRVEISEGGILNSLLRHFKYKALS